MTKTCRGNGVTDRAFIEALSDERLLQGLASHQDPNWWQRADIKRENQAYLRRWGTYLRREARKRGLLPLKGVDV